MSSPALHGTSRTGWFKSSYSSSTGTCVEVRFDGSSVAVRDSKNRPGVVGSHPEPMLTFTAQQWNALLDGLSG